MLRKRLVAVLVRISTVILMVFSAHALLLQNALQLFEGQCFVFGAWYLDLIFIYKMVLGLGEYLMHGSEITALCLLQGIHSSIVLKINRCGALLFLLLKTGVFPDWAGISFCGSWLPLIIWLGATFMTQPEF